MKKCEINFSERIRKAAHVGTGSLYGVIENIPCQKYISEIKPSVIVCPAVAGEENQQKFGEAVRVAERIKEVGGKVQVRLADFFPGWYDYYGLEDWMEKVALAVRKMQEAQIDNIHCYEIWNEPEETWKGLFLTPRTDTIDYYLAFRVTVPKADEYQITMHYANGDQKEHLQWMGINGGKSVLVHYPSTDGWLSSGAYGDVSWNVKLNEGENIIKFSRASEGYIELDYLDVCHGTPVRYEAETAIRGGFIQQNSGFASSKLSGNQTFNEFYSCSQKKIRELDPHQKILGPSFAVYTSQSIYHFLDYQKKAGTLPDIICWHQLADENFTENVKNYREIEKKLNISQIPICVNEYSGGKWHDDEGKPGACAPLIAKFERYSVESACQSFWNAPGRMGSLLTDEEEPNGGYWFYKWYADMSGDMVEVSAPDPSNIRALDAFACIDEEAGYISILFGGETEEKKMEFTLRNIPARFGEKVCVQIERTRFLGRKKATPSPEILEKETHQIVEGSLTLLVNQLEPEDGYRIYITARTDRKG